MKNVSKKVILLLLAAGLSGAVTTLYGQSPQNMGDPSQVIANQDYYSGISSPLHFKPDIKEATNEQCLACHKEILQRPSLPVSPAGVESAKSLAWYQTLSTYEGEQQTFHQRHLTGKLADQVMDLKCNTCHQGNDPREEVSESSATAEGGLTMRKMSDPYICVMCHGQSDYKKMGLPAPWAQSHSMFPGGCMSCHVTIKPERHEGITFLKRDAIETRGKEDSNVCYGCHGGRSWYRTAFPYAAKQWPGWGEVPYGAESKYSKTAGSRPTIIVPGAPATAPAVAAAPAPQAAAAPTAPVAPEPAEKTPAPAAPEASTTASAAAAAPKAPDSPKAATTSKLSGEKAYKSICHACHDTGVALSPLLGDKKAWAPRLATGKEAMMKTVLDGKGTMPPRGGSQLSDDEISAAIDYIISKSQ